MAAVVKPRELGLAKLIETGCVRRTRGARRTNAACAASSRECLGSPATLIDVRRCRSCEVLACGHATRRARTSASSARRSPVRRLYGAFHTLGPLDVQPAPFDIGDDVVARCRARRDPAGRRVRAGDCCCRARRAGTCRPGRRRRRPHGRSAAALRPEPGGRTRARGQTPAGRGGSRAGPRRPTPRSRRASQRAHEPSAVPPRRSRLRRPATRARRARPRCVPRRTPDRSYASRRERFSLGDEETVRLGCPDELAAVVAAVPACAVHPGRHPTWPRPRPER